MSGNADASNAMEDNQEEQIDKSSSLVEDPKIACNPIQETKAIKKIPKSQTKAMINMVEKPRNSDKRDSL